MSKNPKTPGSLFRDAIGLAGRVLKTPINLPGLRRGETAAKPVTPGAMPGIEGLLADAPELDPSKLIIQCIDYSPERVESKDITDVDAFLAEPRPDWATVRWINVDGLNVRLVDMFRQHYGFHTLAAEDVMNIPQRSKVEPYQDHQFIIARMVMMLQGKLRTEQISLFLYDDTLITFQEADGDVWDPIRQRIGREGSRLRLGRTGYLLYALLDAIVDHCFPILERYGDVLEDLEERAMGNPSPQLLHQLHGIRRELLMLRRLLWPMREMIDRLVRDEENRLSENARTYLRDVYDHVIQVVDIVETYREMAAGISDLYMSSVSNRMNEVMKVLTIMASLFIPVTFLAGVYGMNFEHIPELKWGGAYPTFWIICITMTVGLLVFFWRKGWIGRE